MVSNKVDEMKVIMFDIFEVWEHNFHTLFGIL